MKIITINGIYSHGAKSTDLLHGPLKALGYQVDDFDYPKLGVLGAQNRTRQKELGKRLASEVNEGDAIIAHSFGCLVALRAMEAGARFSAVIFLSAAMNADFVFPHHGMRALLNIHNPADRALSIAKLMRWNDLGEMGAMGYNGAPDCRVRNLNWLYSDDGCLNHHHYFKGDHPDLVVTHTDRLIKEVTGNG